MIFHYKRWWGWGNTKYGCRYRLMILMRRLLYVPTMYMYLVSGKIESHLEGTGVEGAGKENL